MFDMKLFKKFKFEQTFFFFLQNLLKCYKLKDDLDTYSIMYSNKLL
jgi:hypothetical protein